MYIYNCTPHSVDTLFDEVKRDTRDCFLMVIFMLMDFKSISLYFKPIAVENKLWHI